MIQKVLDSRGLGVGYIVAPTEGCNAGGLVAFLPGSYGVVLALPAPPPKAPQPKRMIKSRWSRLLNEVTCECGNSTRVYKSGIASCDYCGVNIDAW